MWGAGMLSGRGGGGGGSRCCRCGPPPLTPCGSQKVMHTRKRHSELYHELNQKFHTFDRYHSQSTAKEKPSPGERPGLSQQRRHQSWGTFKSMTLGSLPPKPRERLGLHRAAAWEPTEPPDGDFQTEV